MNRRLTICIAAASALVGAACGNTDEVAPEPTSVVDTLATTTTAVPDTTVPPTTVPARPVVTAVPMGIPAAHQATTTSTTTTTTTTTVVDTTPPPPREGSPSQIPDDQWTPTNPSSSEPTEVGWIQIPKLGVQYTTYRSANDADPAATSKALDNGPAFWGTTTKPGETGNVLIAGHRVSHGAYFRNIDQLEVGDEIIVAGLDGVPYTYLVEKTVIIAPEEVWIADPREGATVTLFACHPPGSVRQRIVVFGNLAA